MIAKYECKCGLKWEHPQEKLGPPECCPQCRSKYFKWSNYEEDFAKKR